MPITLSEPLQECNKLDMITYILIMQNTADTQIQLIF